MPDKLGRLMFDFAATIRRYRSAAMSQIEEAVGLSEREVAILDYVYAKGQATFGEITRELHILEMPRTSASTISQTISALYVKYGLVEKRLNPKDQRQPIITLTEKGKILVEKITELRVNMLKKVRDSMELDDSAAEIMEKAFARGIENFDKIAGLK